MLHHQKKADSRELLPVGRYQSIFKLEKERCNEEGWDTKTNIFLTNKRDIRIGRERDTMKIMLMP